MPSPPLLKAGHPVICQLYFRSRVHPPSASRCYQTRAHGLAAGGPESRGPRHQAVPEKRIHLSGSQHADQSQPQPVCSLLRPAEFLGLGDSGHTKVLAGRLAALDLGRLWEGTVGLLHGGLLCQGTLHGVWRLSSGYYSTITQKLH